LPTRWQNEPSFWNPYWTGTPQAFRFQEIAGLAGKGFPFLPVLFAGRNSKICTGKGMLKQGLCTS